MSHITMRKVWALKLLAWAAALAIALIVLKAFGVL